MISKERLEELIEQGATIYYYNPNAVNLYNLSSTPNVIELGKRETTIIGDELETFITRFYTNGRMEKVYRNIYDIKYLFENKEEFDWLLEFGNIQRTETLSLPTWEDMQNKIQSNGFGNKVIANFDSYVFEYKKSLNLQVVIGINLGSETLYYGDLTKENYLEACRLAKKLFLGEKE